MEHTVHLNLRNDCLEPFPDITFTLVNRDFRLYKYYNTLCLQTVSAATAPLLYISWILGDSNGFSKREVVGQGASYAFVSAHQRLAVNNVLTVTIRMRDPKYQVSNLFNDPQLADLHCCVYDQVLYLHKCIICSESPVIKAMVDKDDCDGTINIDGEFSLDVVKYSFAYVYDELKSAGLPQNIDMCAVCCFASKYGLRALEAHCIETLKSGLGIVNCWERWKFAKEHNYFSLKFKADEVLKDHRVDVFRHYRKNAKSTTECEELAVLLFDKQYLEELQKNP